LIVGRIGIKRTKATHEEVQRISRFENTIII